MQFVCTIMEPSDCIYIYNLPFSVIQNISVMMDTDNKWKYLGGLMEFDITTLTLFGQCLYNNRSPTEKLLLDWGNKNHTVLELFFLLEKLKYFRAMAELKPYVNSYYHYLLQQQPSPPPVHELPNSYFSMGIASNNDLPVPTFHHDEFRKSYPTSMRPCENTEIIPSSRISNNKLNTFSENNDKMFDKADFNEQFCNYYGYHDIKKNMQTFQNFTKNTVHTEQVKISNEIQRGLVDSLPSEPFNEDQVKSCMVPSYTTNISYCEILEGTNHFDSSGIIGQGAFGIVYRGRWRHTTVAIKRIKIDSENIFDNANRIKQSFAELRNILLYHHDNILPLYGYSSDGREPCLIYMYMVNGSLEDRLSCKDNTPPLSWNKKYKIALGTARGLQFLHTSKPPLIHGDIKSANILLDKSFEAKIGDFGLAHIGEISPQTHIITHIAKGTTSYLPPEYLRGQKLSTKVDTYSFGVVLFELATGLKAINESKRTLLRDYIFEQKDDGILKLQDNKSGEDVYHYFQAFISMGKSCSSTRKNNRPEMTEVLEYFDSIPLKIMMNTATSDAHTPQNLPIQFECDNLITPLNKMLEDNFSENLQIVNENNGINNLPDCFKNTSYFGNQSVGSFVSPEINQLQHIIEMPFIKAKYKSLPF